MTRIEGLQSTLPNLVRTSRPATRIALAFAPDGTLFVQANNGALSLVEGYRGDGGSLTNQAWPIPFTVTAGAWTNRASASIGALHAAKSPAG